MIGISGSAGWEYGHLVTSESPTTEPMDVRVAAHLAAVEVMVEAQV
ncbi:MAG: M14 family metallocarboxypeptidase [Gemmatimonadetes bacterium]|nr:M14 family metallocarboxypeptidase [Gemmatimonadota bacterium]